MSEFTHRQLVERGGQWLHMSQRCHVVLMERTSTCASEEPDAIGWTRAHSILIEAKATRSDFLSDKKKPHRRFGGMGRYRYYLCPRGMIQPEEVPEDWGLLWATEHQIRLKKGPTMQVFSELIAVREIGMLTKALRQIKVGCIIRQDPENSFKKLT